MTVSELFGLKSKDKEKELETEETAEEVWNICNEKLQQPEYSARGLIKMSNVTLVCTTDDPADTLEWHQKIKADEPTVT